MQYMIFQNKNKSKNLISDNHSDEMNVILICNKNNITIANYVNYVTEFNYPIISYVIINCNSS